MCGLAVLEQLGVAVRESSSRGKISARRPRNLDFFKLDLNRGPWGISASYIMRGYNKGKKREILSYCSFFTRGGAYISLYVCLSTSKARIYYGRHSVAAQDHLSFKYDGPVIA
jgi:hypothetical protein